jgi:hypothetical protein
MSMRERSAAYRRREVVSGESGAGGCSAAMLENFSLLGSLSFVVQRLGFA